MSISSVKTGTIGDSLLAGNAGYDPAATFLIQRIAGTGSSGTITFSSIPQNYKHLQIRCMTRSTDSGTTTYESNISLNGQTAYSNYAYHVLAGNGSSVSASGWASGTDRLYAIQNARDTMTAGIMGTSIIDIHDYSSTTKNKTIRVMRGCDVNGSGEMRLSSGLFLSTNAISSIELYSLVGSWTTSSTFALYGMVG